MTAPVDNPGGPAPPPEPGSIQPGPRVALSLAQQLELRRHIEAVLPGARVAVFGSRSTGRARPHSDLDLLLIEPPRLSWAERAALREAFEASQLPFCVDLVELAGLDAGLARRVLGEAIGLP